MDEEEGTTKGKTGIQLEEAETMGAKPVNSIFIGWVAQKEHSAPPEKAIRQARLADRHSGKISKAPAVYVRS